jgi:hypothetical protein
MAIKKRRLNAAIDASRLTKFVGLAAPAAPSPSKIQATDTNSVLAAGLIVRCAHSVVLSGTARSQARGEANSLPGPRVEPSLLEFMPVFKQNTSLSVRAVARLQLSQMNLNAEQRAAACAPLGQVSL